MRAIFFSLVFGRIEGKKKQFFDFLTFSKCNFIKPLTPLCHMVANINRIFGWMSYTCHVKFAYFCLFMSTFELCDSGPNKTEFEFHLLIRRVLILSHFSKEDDFNFLQRALKNIIAKGDRLPSFLTASNRKLCHVMYLKR